MADALAKVPEVEIDPEGTFKYILVRVKVKDGDVHKDIVRGTKSAEYHSKLLPVVCSREAWRGSCKGRRAPSCSSMGWCNPLQCVFWCILQICALCITNTRIRHFSSLISALWKVHNAHVVKCYICKCQTTCIFDCAATKSYCVSWLELLTDHIFEKVNPAMEALGMECKCLGGGRIEHNSQEKKLRVFGESTVSSCHCKSIKGRTRSNMFDAIISVLSDSFPGLWQSRPFCVCREVEECLQQLWDHLVWWQKIAKCLPLFISSKIKKHWVMFWFICPNILWFLILWSVCFGPCESSNTDSYDWISYNTTQYSVFSFS